MYLFIFFCMRLCNVVHYTWTLFVFLWRVCWNVDRVQKFRDFCMWGKQGRSHGRNSFLFWGVQDSIVPLKAHPRSEQMYTVIKREMTLGEVCVMTVFSCFSSTGASTSSMCSWSRGYQCVFCQQQSEALQLSKSVHFLHKGKCI